MPPAIVCPLCKLGKMKEDGRDETEIGHLTYYLCSVCRARLPVIRKKKFPNTLRGIGPGQFKP